MATSDQIKALVKSFADGDADRFRTVTLQIAAHSAKRGQTDFATELRDLMDKARIRVQHPVGQARAVPIARPSGELAGLLTVSYPSTRLADMVLAPDARARVIEVIRQFRQRELLRSHNLSPRRRLLLVGPPGCGKTMTASALAGECRLPLMSVQLHGLITKFLGETAAKLHLVFEAMSQTTGVYLFDEFDALGATRTAQNDVGEIRRVLNSFLQFMERDSSDSIIVAATNLVDMLDPALFRRFDDVIAYAPPSAGMIRELIENRLSAFDTSLIAWPAILRSARSLSHADISRACDDAAKSAVLAGTRGIETQDLTGALRFRHALHASGRPRKKRA
jgi:SpoVK/Ycf46/Vps4 family AAA+-type ATPase